jgi:hypothetical protein
VHIQGDDTRPISGVSRKSRTYSQSLLRAMADSLSAPIKTASGSVIMLNLWTHGDMPDQNEQCRCKHQSSAIRPCRFCLVDKPHLSASRPSASLRIRRERRPWAMQSVQDESKL